MGFFDFTCMVSGMSLCASKTALILLEKKGNDYIPIALPIVGQYNRIGGIDMIVENQHTETIFDFFQSKILSGEAHVNWSDVYVDGEFIDKVDNIEQLIASIERGVTLDYDCFKLGNNRISYCLIDQRIWEAIIHTDLDTTGINLPQSKTWNAIYGNAPVPTYQEELLQFKKLQCFLDRYAIKWTPPTNPGQHSNEEIVDQLKQVKILFKDDPLWTSILTVFNR